MKAKKTKKTRKQQGKGTLIIEENLKAFIPPVSRMGGANPVDWGWSEHFNQAAHRAQNLKVS